MQFITLVHCGLLYTFVMIWIALRETLASFLRRNPELEERIVNRFGFLSLEFKTASIPSWYPSDVVSTGKKLGRLWFDAGILASVTTAVLFVCFLVWNLVHALSSSSSLSQLSEATGAHMTPLVPGVNLPLTDAGFLLGSIAIAASFHEYGHAMAAFSDSVPVLSFGVIVIAFIVPGAFVRLCDSLAHQTPRVQLRAYCGGVWHNLVLAWVAAVLLPACLPLALFPFYTRGEGVLAASLPYGSPLAGPIVGGDVITHVNFMPLGPSGKNWRSITSMEYPPLLCGAASDGFPSLSSPSSLSSVSCCEGEGVGVCVSLLPLPTGHTVCGPSSPRRVCASPASIRSASTHCVRGSGKEGEAVCTAPSSAITDLFCALPVSNATSTASGSTRALSNSARNDNTSPTPTLIQTSTTLPGEHPPTLDARLLITSTASANPQSESADNVYLLSLARGSRVGFLGTGYQLFSAVKPGEYAPRPWLASVFPTAFRVEDYKPSATTLATDSLLGLCADLWAKTLSHCRMLCVWWALSCPSLALRGCHWLHAVSLSLALFNSLPLPLMDGSHTLRVCVAACVRCGRGRKRGEEEEGERDACSIERTCVIVTRIVAGLVAANVALALTSLFL